MKRLRLTLILVTLALLAIVPSSAAHRACVVIDSAGYIEGSCIYKDRTICCDGPESCVLVTHLKVWCIGDPPVSGPDN